MPSKFRHTVHGPADDLNDGIHYRSRWERNIRRVLNYKSQSLGILLIEYETITFPFFGAQYRRNKHYRSDFRVIVSKDAINAFIWYIEPKGFLKRGGRLSTLELSSLKGRDDVSRIKLTAMQKQYPAVAKRIWVLGEREYRWLERRYKAKIPAWESNKVVQSSIPKRRSTHDPDPHQRIA